MLRAPLKDIAARAAEAGVCRQALLLVGRALSDPAGDDGASSKLYCRDFSHGYRSSLEDERFEGRVAVLAFSRRGEAKAREIVTGLGAGRAEFLQGGVRESVFRDAWTRFDGVICVGATGIAVRLAAPLLGDKCTDPALVAVDERGRFAVSLAGGHLGGANRLARRTARVTGGQAVISTGTDCESLTAFDEAASREGCRILNAGEPRAHGRKGRFLLRAGGNLQKILGRVPERAPRRMDGRSLRALGHGEGAGGSLPGPLRLLAKPHARSRVPEGR